MKGKCFLTMFFVLFFNGLCFAQTTVVASVRMEIKNSLIYLDSVSVNGLSSRNFIIDTGSGLMVLDEGFVSRLNLPDKGKRDKAISGKDVQGNVARKRLVRIDSLKIGKLLFYNLEAVVTDLSVVNEEMEGIIGANCLTSKIWKLDFPANKIDVLSKVDASEFKYRIPLKMKKGLPHLNLKIAGIVLKDVLFDSGNANRFSLPSKDSILLKDKSDKDIYSSVLAGSLFGREEKVVRTKQSLFTSVYLDRLKVDSCYAVFIGKYRAIGIPFVQASAIVIDYPNKKLYTNDLPQKAKLGFGCRFKITDRGKIAVYAIREDSFAAQQGLRLGDELIAFDNIEPEELKAMIRNGSIYEKMDSTTIIKRKNAAEVAIMSRLDGE